MVTEMRVSLESARSLTNRRRSKSMFAPEQIATTWTTKKQTDKKTDRQTTDRQTTDRQT